METAADPTAIKTSQNQRFQSLRRLFRAKSSKPSIVDENGLDNSRFNTSPIADPETVISRYYPEVPRANTFSTYHDYSSPPNHLDNYGTQLTFLTEGNGVPPSTSWGVPSFGVARQQVHPSHPTQRNNHNMGVNQIIWYQVVPELPEATSNRPTVTTRLPPQTPLLGWEDRMGSMAVRTTSSPPLPRFVDIAPTDPQPTTALPRAATIPITPPLSPKPRRPRRVPLLPANAALQSPTEPYSVSNISSSSTSPSPPFRDKDAVVEPRSLEPDDIGPYRIHSKTPDHISASSVIGSDFTPEEFVNAQTIRQETTRESPESEKLAKYPQRREREIREALERERKSVFERCIRERDEWERREQQRKEREQAERRRRAERMRQEREEKEKWEQKERELWAEFERNRDNERKRQLAHEAELQERQREAKEALRGREKQENSRMEQEELTKIRLKLEESERREEETRKRLAELERRIREQDERERELVRQAEVQQRNGRLNRHARRRKGKNMPARSKSVALQQASSSASRRSCGCSSC